MKKINRLKKFIVSFLLITCVFSMCSVSFFASSEAEKRKQVLSGSSSTSSSSTSKPASEAAKKQAVTNVEKQNSSTSTSSTSTSKSSSGTTSSNSGKQSSSSSSTSKPTSEAAKKQAVINSTGSNSTTSTSKPTSEAAKRQANLDNSSITSVSKSSSSSTSKSNSSSSSSNSNSNSTSTSSGSTGGGGGHSFATQSPAASASSAITDLVSEPCRELIAWMDQQVEDALVCINSGLITDFSPTSNFMWQSLGIDMDATGDNDPKDTLLNVFYMIGYFLTIGVFCVSLFAFVTSPMNDQKNNLFELILRFMIACVFISCSISLLTIVSSWAMQIFKLIPDRLHIDTNLMYSASNFKFSAVPVPLQLILLISVAVEYIKLLLEIIERYIVCTLLLYMSPVWGGMIVSRSTSSIAVNAFRMYISELFLLWMNKLFATMAVVLVAHNQKTLIAFCFVIAFLKAAQRIDAYMKSMGLSVAQTGGAILDSIMAAVGTLSSLGRLNKAGAGIAGASMSQVGSLTGNSMIARVGDKMSAFGKGGVAGLVQPMGQADSLKNFASAGGVANAIARNDAHAGKVKAALANQAIAAYKSGGFGAVAMTDRATQAAVARNILGQSGLNNNDAFGKVFGGFTSKDIKSAQIDGKGNITGTASVTGKDGNIQSVKFAASAENLGKRSNVVGSQALGSDGKDYMITSTSSGQIADHTLYQCGEDGISNLSAITGKPYNDQALVALGAHDIEMSDGMMYVKDEDGNTVYRESVETGNGLYSTNEELRQSFVSELGPIQGDIFGKYSISNDANTPINYSNIEDITGYRREDLANENIDYAPSLNAVHFNLKDGTKVILEGSSDNNPSINRKLMDKNCRIVSAGTGNGDYIMTVRKYNEPKKD